MSKRKKLMFILPLWLILVGVGIIIYYFYFYSFKFTYINNVICDGDYCYIIDDDDDKIRLIRIKNGYEDSCVEYDKISEQRLYNQTLGCCVDDNTLYINNFYNEIGYIQENYDIYAVNFECKDMQKVSSFTQQDFEQTFKDEDYELYDVEFCVNEGRVNFIISVYDQSAEGMKILKLVHEDEKWLVIDEVLCEDYAGDVYCTQDDYLIKTLEGSVLETRDDKIYELSNDSYSAVYKISENKFVGANLCEKSFDIIDAENQTVQPFERLNNMLKAEQINFTEVTNIYCAEDKIYLSLYNDQNARFAVFDAGQLNVTQSLKAHNKIFFTALCGGIIFVSFLLAVLIFTVGDYFKNYSSVAAKLTAVVIPIILICDGVFYFAASYILENKNINYLHESLVLEATQYVSLNLASDFEDFHEYDSPENERYTDYAEFISQLYLIHDEPMYYASQHDDKNSLITSINFYGADASKGTFLSVYGSLLNADIDNLLEPKFAQTIRESASDGNMRFYSYYDSIGQLNSCVIMPALDKNSQVNGVYVISASSSEADYEARILLKKIILYQLLLSVIIFFLFIIITVFSLHPLKGLRKKAVNFTNEDQIGLEDKKRKNYADEITLISDGFDNMEESVRRNFEEMINLRQSGKAYFSDDILRLLGKENISLLNFKENAQVQLYVLTAKLNEKYNNFVFLSGLICDLAPHLKLYNAFIIDADGGKLTAASDNPKLINIAFFLNQHDKDVRIVFDKTPVNISIVGSENNYLFSFCFEDISRRKMLLKCCEQLKASFAVCENSFDNDSLEISKLCIGMIDGERIYEILSDSHSRYAKLVRKYMLNGVEMYFKGEYVRAREFFILTLKIDNENYAAKYYIKLIDGSKAMGKEGE